MRKTGRAGPRPPARLRGAACGSRGAAAPSRPAAWGRARSPSAPPPPPAPGAALGSPECLVPFPHVACFSLWRLPALPVRVCGQGRGSRRLSGAPAPREAPAQGRPVGPPARRSGWPPSASAGRRPGPAAVKSLPTAQASQPILAEMEEAEPGRAGLGNPGPRRQAPEPGARPPARSPAPSFALKSAVTDLSLVSRCRWRL